MTTLFVSDLHLDAARPAITALFVRFLETEARTASALYILGDLFEAWIGDDAGDAAGAVVADALAHLHDGGVPVFFIAGNRDFLIGDDWARRARATLLDDPVRVVIEGRATLLSHGDLFCTDDIGYQAFRRQVHAPDWQRAFLSRDVAVRSAIAAQARAESRRQTADKEMSIMDVNIEAVDAALRHAGVDRLIHGHTHRPDVHRFDVDGRAAERIVLGDWYEQGSVLRVGRELLDLAVLPVAGDQAGHRLSP